MRELIATEKYNRVRFVLSLWLPLCSYLSYLYLLKSIIFVCHYYQMNKFPMADRSNKQFIFGLNFSRAVIFYSCSRWQYCCRHGSPRKIGKIMLTFDAGIARAVVATCRFKVLALSVSQMARMWACSHNGRTGPFFFVKDAIDTIDQILLCS